MRSCIPQKQPPARIAVSADVVTVVLLLLGRARSSMRRSVLFCCGPQSRVSGSPDQGVAVSGLPEGEGVGLGAGVGEHDLEGALGDGSVLPDELVQPLLGKRAAAVPVHVDSVIRAGW